MKKNLIWICAAAVAVALLVFLLVLLLPGQNTPDPSTGATTTEAAGDPTDTQISPDGTSQPSEEATDSQLSADPTASQPTQGSNPLGGNSPTDPTVSAGVVENWPDDPDPTEPNPTDPGKETEPKPTDSDKEAEPKPTEPDKETEPGKETAPTKDMKDLTYAQWVSLSGENQQRFYEAFCEKYGKEAFDDWFIAARAVYDAQQAEGVVSGDGNIDISDYIGGN